MVKKSVYQNEENTLSMPSKEFTYSLFYIITIGVIGLILTPFLVGIVILLMIPGLINTKIIVGEKGLKIQKGMLIKTTEDISYKKINNVVCETSFGNSSGTIKIYTGNDKPIRYRMIKDVHELKDMINEKIEA